MVLFVLFVLWFYGSVNKEVMLSLFLGSTFPLAFVAG